jgi:hypothetical protein
MMPITEHCRMPFTSGCKGGRASSTVQVYMLMFRGRIRMSTKCDKPLNGQMPHALQVMSDLNKQSLSARRQLVSEHTKAYPIFTVVSI